MISLDQFPDNSKVWVYQADRTFAEDEISKLNPIFEHFVEDWFSHGKGLKARIETRYNQFIVVIVDECGDRMCGSAVDGSVQFMKEIEKDFGVVLLDRMATAWREGNEIRSLHLNEFRELVNNGVVNPETIVFNNTITTKAELDNSWEIPMNQSWHKQLLPLETT